MVTSILKRMWWIRIITEMISSKIFVYVGFTDLKLPAFNALCHRYIPWDRLFHSQYTKWRKNLELKKTTSSVWRYFGLPWPQYRPAYRFQRTLLLTRGSMTFLQSSRLQDASAATMTSLMVNMGVPDIPPRKKK